jgi:hypothetical protein
MTVKTPFTIAAMLGAADLAEANSFCDTVKQHAEYTIVLCKDDSTGGVAVFNKGGNDGLWFVLKSSPAIGAVHWPRARMKVRGGRVKSPIASISYRTYARPFRRNSAAPLDHLYALCCRPRTAMTSPRQ